MRSIYDDVFRKIGLLMYNLTMLFKKLFDQNINEKNLTIFF